MRLFEGTQFDVPPRCERCNELESECQCEPVPEPSIAPEKQTLKIAVEKRKRGKCVTVVRGLADDPKQVADLLTTLKNKCGGGGTIKEGNIEIQGDHAERMPGILSGLGYRLR